MLDVDGYPFILKEDLHADVTLSSSSTVHMTPIPWTEKHALMEFIFNSEIYICK